MSERLKAVSIMIRATHHLEAVLKQDIESYGLNTTEFGALEYLYHKGPKAIQQICGKLLMANSSMTYVIDKLEAKGLVARTPSKRDRRVFTISLTEQGKALIEDIFPKHEKTIQDIFSPLSDEEMKTMNDLLKIIGKHSESLHQQKGEKA